MHQKALIVKTHPGDTHGLDELNLALRRGWRVAQVAPMGGAGVGARGDAPELCFAALVVLERRDRDEADVLAQAEEEPEEVVDDLVDDIVEGDGSNLDVEGL